MYSHPNMMAGVLGRIVGAEVQNLQCDARPKINHFKTVQLKGDVIVFIDQRLVDVSVSCGRLLDFLSDP